MNTSTNTIKVAFTGPRSFKLYGTNPDHSNYVSLVYFIQDLILSSKVPVGEVYIGMASGLDIMAGLAVLNFNKQYKQDIKLFCCIPGKNQTDKFTDKEKRIYDYILSKVPEEQVLVLSQEDCTGKVLKARSRFMIDHADMLISFWDGYKFKSGSWSAINYAATKANKPVYNVNPFNFDDRGYYYHPDKTRDEEELRWSSGLY